MTDDRHRFLLLLEQPPARLNSEQAAWLLNCQPHDIPVLVGARLLRPLDDPRPNSVKYFATLELLELSKDRSWLVKATRAIGLHWMRKNRRRAVPCGPQDEEVQTSFVAFMTDPTPPAALEPQSRKLPSA